MHAYNCCECLRQGNNLGQADCAQFDCGSIFLPMHPTTSRNQEANRQVKVVGDRDAVKRKK